MIKKILYIIIPILSVLLMSHNVNAASQTIYLKNGIYAYGIPAITGGQGGNTVDVLSGESINLFNNTYRLPGSKIWYSLHFYLNSEHTAVDISKYTDFTFSFSYCSDVPAHFVPSSNDYYRMTDVSEISGITYYNFTGTNYAQQNPQSISGTLSASDECNSIITKGKVGVKSINGFSIGTTANGSFTRLFNFNQYDILNMSPSDYLYIISPTVVFYDNPNEAEEALQKEKQEVQTAANNSQSSGNSSQSDSQSATSSLLSVITAGVGAITSASPTNCKINGNMGNLNIGNIDLCANPVPTFMAVIGSIIAVLVVLPLVILLFNRFIGIIRSFQT